MRTRKTIASAIWDMLMQKRFCAIMLVVCICLSLNSSVLAIGSESFSSVIEADVRRATTAFMDSYLSEVYLYNEHDFSASTILSLSEEHLNTVPSVDLRGTRSNLTVLTANIDYLKNKAEYWKHVRTDQGIFREDFTVTYVFNAFDISSVVATVYLAAQISFQYLDSDAPSYIEECFIIDLVRVDGVWLIADAFQKLDWFDDMYKDNESFNIAYIIAEYQYLRSIEADAGVIEPYEVPPEPTRATTLNYNAENATAYAYTYSSSTAGTSVYNSNFKSFSGDCMNFASQSIWAGLGGSNNASHINAHKAPMDGLGTQNWFSSDSSGAHSGSWSSCNDFATYTTLLNSNPSDTGVLSTKYNVPYGANFSVISNYMTVLYGAILHVPGTGGDYSHAIVVTDVAGSNRSSVYYCAHTTDAKNVKVGDHWAVHRINVIKPTSFYAQSTLSNPRITATLFRPVAISTTLTLSANTTVSCYSIVTTVTTPSGTSTSSTKNNSSTATWNYTFSSTGLYVIKVSAKETSSSTAVDYYYTIRVY